MNDVLHLLQAHNMYEDKLSQHPIFLHRKLERNYRVLVFMPPLLSSSYPAILSFPGLGFNEHVRTLCLPCPL